MSGTDGEEDFKALDGEEDLGLFGDLSAFEGLGIEEESAVGEQSSESGGVHCPHCLGKYKNPRVLSCLHVLCETCLKELLMSAGSSDGDDDNEAPYSGRKSRTGIITCPQCRQETVVGDRGLTMLPLDPIYQRITGVEGLSGLICTSCKANEEAVAKCVVCDNLLCSNCNTAHKYMRLFENHKVVTFEELSQSGQPVVQLVKKSPAACNRHPNESYKYYCFTCQTMACAQCLKTHHVGLDHRTEHVNDAETRCREELAHFSQEMNARQINCRLNANRYEKMLGELQVQHDAARATVEQVHRQYLDLLEKKREQAMEELAALHAKQELGVMEACERVDRVRDRIQTALRYTKQVLSEAETAGLLNVHSCIKAQMQLLHNAATRPIDESVHVLLKFESNVSRFEDAINSSYGYVVRPSSSQHSGGGSSSSSSIVGITSKPVSSLGLPTPASTPQPPSPTHSSPLEPPMGGYTNLNAAAPPVPCGTMKNDLSSSNSSNNLMMQSSMDQPMQNHGHAGSAAAMPEPMLGSGLHMQPYSGSTATAYGRNVGDQMNSAMDSHLTSGMTSIQEYNLQRLASLASAGKQQQQRNSNHNECHNSIHQQLQQQRQSHLNPSNNRQSQSSPILQQQPAQPFTLADLLSGDVNATSHALNNLQALAKLGSQNSLGLNLPLDSLGGSSHLAGVGGVANVQGMGTNLGLLVNGSSPSPSSATSPLEASLLASALSAPPFVPSASSRPSSSVSMSSSPGGPVLTGTPPLIASSATSSSKYISMQTRVRFGQLGSAHGQFNSPHGFCLGIDEDIVVADTNNHRIQVFSKDGDFKYHFGVAGKEEGQMWYPRKVAVIRQSGKIVVCDRGSERSRMQIFTRNGQFIKRIVIRYIDIVAGLAIDDQGHIVAVDSVSPTVFRITENGELVKWFDCSDRMREPSDLAIHAKEYYICDFKGHCVIVFNEEGDYLRRIGYETITNFPNGIDISDAGDVLIGDSHGNRFHVAVFSRAGALLSEFECPHVKVSRCCGLKITSEGYVITLAKNNHYVLVLNTLYIV